MQPPIILHQPELIEITKNGSNVSKVTQIPPIKNTQSPPVKTINVDEVPLDNYSSSIISCSTRAG